MTTLSDAIRAVVGGISGNVNDGLKAYFAANGGVGTNLLDLERSFLISQLGLTAPVAATTNDLWRQFLVDFTGALPDQLLQFWLAGGAVESWSPALWFLASEQGVWYDPSDMSTMFQDSAGTTPVTAVEQVVGKILDKSGRGNHATQATAGSRPKLSARKNWLLASEDFSAAAWVKITTTVVANSAAASDGSITADRLVPAATNTVHQVYANAAGVTVAAGQRWTGSVDLKADGCGFCYVELAAGAANGLCVNLATGAITNTSGGLVAGTAEDKGNGWWRVNVTADTTAAYAYLQVYPRDVAGTGAAWLGDGVNGVLMTRAQLEPGPTATTYQRVTTATDYDSVGFPHYLKFDGVDDSLATAAIDFTGTDKMTEVLGLTFLNSTFGIIYEMSPTIAANAGTFGRFAGVASSKHYPTNCRGSAAIASYAGMASSSQPDTCVLSATFDIAGDLTRTRRNGVYGLDESTDKGTGNFTSQPLFIGRRNSAASPAAFQLNELILRGAATADLTPGETFAAEKTGVPL